MKKIKLFVFSFALALVFSTIPLSSASAACESRFPFLVAKFTN